jgi:hypothetical protein
MKLKHLFLIVFILFLSSYTPAQMRYYIVKGGVQYNQSLLFAEFNHYRFSFLARGYMNVRFNNVLSGELGVGYGRIAGTDAIYNPDRKHWSTSIIPVDLRLRIAPFRNSCYINPYLYLGGGFLRYDVSEKHVSPTVDPIEESGFTPMVLGGIGTEIKLSQNLLLDLSAGMTYTFTDNLNYYSINVYKDAYGTVGIGLTFTKESCDTDRDQDGLPRCIEERLGTDPENEDTDGDGLRDGVEVAISKTNPLEKDSDGDGWNDYEEVKVYKTDPNDPESNPDKLMKKE